MRPCAYNDEEHQLQPYAQQVTPAPCPSQQSAQCAHLPGAAQDGDMPPAPQRYRASPAILTPKAPGR